jgi:periplasmic protein TonB
MKTNIRTSLVPIFVVLAGLSGCSSVITATTAVASTVGNAAKAVVRPFTSSPSSPASKPAPAGLDDYKAQVAQHVLQHNPERSFNGKLPPMLPAVVVLEITVDRDGQLADVAVQRSRDPDASQIALDSMRRSTPLPPPQQLAQATGKLTFSETFLFADANRYQLRSLAGPQTAD